jgi:hypothetical protein
MDLSSIFLKLLEDVRANLMQEVVAFRARNLEESSVEVHEVKLNWIGSS